ncbi:unnamed protein product [Oppiella nova]|uniref:COMM domain-containing protein n=1 Tax=Oppiella nova TaxID=334625 RepID=A0A7R9M7G8_9ACAR|nr:unnamed protein product [Oppiella nova]CAG2171014.1 unnamed protein product [Oppiella nova]
MRFRFCGQNDCQDWLLAQISSLSKLVTTSHTLLSYICLILTLIVFSFKTSIKMKLLCNECVMDLIDNQMNFEKMVKVGSDAKLDTEDMKACISAVQYILSTSSKYNTDSETLSHELQQLGLPKEHSSSLCRVYSENFDRLQEALKQRSLRLSRLNAIEYKIDTQFNGSTHRVKAPALQISIDTLRDHMNEKTMFYVTHEKLSALLYELKQSLQLMDEISV